MRKWAREHGLLPANAGLFLANRVPANRPK